MKEQFIRNIGTISEEQQQMLFDSKAAVIGCGGLGGFLCEYMVRAGVGHIIAFDGDSFAESNLNRQITSSRDALGKNKAAAAKARALSINPDIDFVAVGSFFDESSKDLLRDCDIILDGLDDPESRLLLEKISEELGLTIVHGALSEWTVQVSTVTPGSKLLSVLYAGASGSSATGTMSFVPAICAGLQASEAIKLLTGQQASLGGKLLLCDLKTMDIDVITL